MSVRLRLGAVAFFVVLSCTSAAVSAQAQEAEPEENTISGVVLNSITHEPIARALVTSTDNRLAAFTDTNGQFEFEIPKRAGEKSSTADTLVNPAASAPPQTKMWTLTALKPGYLRQSPGGAAYINVRLGQKDVTLPLTPEALIVGKVAFPDPTNRARVELYRREVRDGIAHWSPTGTVHTRSDGEFRFADLAAGQYKLFTREVLDRDPLTVDPGGQLYGYPPVYFPAASDFGSAGVITVAAGQTFQANLSPAKQRYYPVSITTTGTMPANDSGLQIVVSAQGHRGPGYELGYDPSQRVISGLLPNGNYTIEALGYGGVLTISSSDGRGLTTFSTSASGMIKLAVAEESINNAVMQLVPNSNIPVNVTEQFTNPASSPAFQIRRATINGARTNYLNVGLEPVDDFGAAPVGSVWSPDSRSLQNVPPGRYWVRVDIDSTQGFVSSLTSGSVNLLRHPLEVGVGGAIAPIELTVRDDGADVEGSVEARAPQDRASGADKSDVIYLIPLSDSAGQFRQLQFGGGSTFTLSQVPPGSYRILAFDREQRDLEYSNPEAMREYSHKGVVVNLVGGQKIKIKVPLISSDEE